MSVKLLTEHYLEFLSLKGGCTGSSESTFVKMPHCWKSHVAARILFFPVYHHAHFKSCHVKTHVQTTCEPYDLNKDFHSFDNGFKSDIMHYLHR